MTREMTKRCETGNCSTDGAGLSRRAILGGAVAGFALPASGLFLPETGEVAAARDGALQGAKGGRRGKDQKGRHRHRTHGGKKDKNKGRNDAPPQNHGPFRATALTVRNSSGGGGFFPPVTLHCTFYYRIKTGLDDYGLPIASVERTVAPGESFRYAPNPDRYRVGVQIKHVILSDDIYADVRNVSFWFPAGGVTGGQNLDPPAGKVGSTLIREQGFDQGEEHHLVMPRLGLERKRDSDTHIEWELTVSQI
jgi:hypothetical protein